MFKRRVPLTRLQKLREWVWPSMGLVRAGRYTMHRLMRIKDTTHKIALGLAMGITRKCYRRVDRDACRKPADIAVHVARGL